MTAEAVAGFATGLVIAAVTAPVGVSGAVFLLPVQLSVFGVPNPSVTPTNLLFNVVATPGALLRYRQQGQLTGPLPRLLITGTVPGVVIGSMIRVYVASGPDTFRVLAALVLLPIGTWLLAGHRQESGRAAQRLSSRAIVSLALIVGVVGGIYGIGGGSILGPRTWSTSPPPAPIPGSWNTCRRFIEPIHTGISVCAKQRAVRGQVRPR